MASGKLHDFRLIKTSSREANVKDGKPSTKSVHRKNKKTAAKKVKLCIAPKSKYQTQLEMVRSLADKELITCCMRNPGDDFYWGEFHYRFGMPIDNHIIKTLYGEKMPKTKEFLAKIPEIKDEINFRLTEKFLTPHIFDAVISHPEFIAWLYTVVRNEVLDWYEEYRRTANVTDEGGVGGIGSFDDTIGSEENDIRRGDTIPDPKAVSPLYDEWSDYLAALLDIVRQKEDALDDAKRLAFKVDLIFYCPLTDQDIREIATRRNVPPQHIEQEITQIMEELHDEQDHLEHQQNLITIRKDNIKRLEWKLRELRANTNTAKSLLAEQNKQIEKAATMLKNLESRVSKRPIGPSVRQLSDLMNLNKAQERDVSVWLKRVKDALKDEKEKRNKKQN